jgi:hypothetical protein
VESPDSTQPELHAGLYSMVPLMSWPWARKVLVPVAEAITLGEVGGLAGAEAGPLRTELADEGELGELAPWPGRSPGSRPTRPPCRSMSYKR